MTRIEECEKLLKKWKAAEKKAEGEEWQECTQSYYKIKMSGMEAAIAIFKRPSNTQMHMDTKPCGERL
jgi:hypothetical protein